MRGHCQYEAGCQVLQSEDDFVHGIGDVGTTTGIQLLLNVAHRYVDERQEAGKHEVDTGQRGKEDG